MPFERIEAMMLSQTINRHTGGERQALYAKVSMVKEYCKATTKFLATVIAEYGRKFGCNTCRRDVSQI